MEQTIISYQMNTFNTNESGKLEIYNPYILQKIKMIINQVLSIKEIVLVVHVTLK